jgi:hypothetical protein
MQSSCKKEAVAALALSLRALAARPIHGEQKLPLNPFRFIKVLPPK